MSSDPRREKYRNQTKHSERNLAATALQNLWDRCHPLSRLSNRKTVEGTTAASLSMPRPLAIERNPMNHTTTNRPASCENHFLFRSGSLLPKIASPRSSRPSVDRIVTIWAPITNPYLYKRPNSALDSPGPQ